MRRVPGESKTGNGPLVTRMAARLDNPDTWREKSTGRSLLAPGSMIRPAANSGGEVGHKAGQVCARQPTTSLVSGGL